MLLAYKHTADVSLQSYHFMHLIQSAIILARSLGSLPPENLQPARDLLICRLLDSLHLLLLHGAPSQQPVAERRLPDPKGLDVQSDRPCTTADARTVHARTADASTASCVTIQWSTCPSCM